MTGARPRNRRAIAGAAVGNGLEWYDFAIYSALTPILSRVFFPGSDPVVGILLAFGVFAAGFLVRPIGSIIFGHFADRRGRKGSLIVALLIMGVATILVGCLPSYASVGVLAPVLLLILRMVQGFAAGGEFGVSAISLVELAPRSRRGFYGSLAYATVLVGNLLGQIFAVALTGTLAMDALDSWGWRIPFLVSVLLLAVGFYLRARMPETDQFLEVKRQQRIVRIPLARAVARYWPQMLIVAGLQVGVAGINYAVLTFMASYLSTILHYELPEATTTVLIATAVFAVLTPVFGRLSDRIGARTVVIGSFIGALVLTFPGFLLIVSGSFPAAIVGLLLVGLADASLSGAVAFAYTSLFPPTERASGFGVPYNIFAAIFGGLAPLLMTLLITATKSNLAPAFYIVIASLISLVAAYFLRRKNAPDLEDEPRDAGPAEAPVASAR